jgi:hypothetical protein
MGDRRCIVPELKWQSRCRCTGGVWCSTEGGLRGCLTVSGLHPGCVIPWFCTCLTYGSSSSSSSNPSQLHQAKQHGPALGHYLLAAVVALTR